jgi:hypothetical protein
MIRKPIVVTFRLDQATWDRMRRTTCSERSEEQSKGYFSIHQHGWDRLSPGRLLVNRDW